MKEKFEAVIYGLRDGEMKIMKTEPSDMALAMAFNEKDNSTIGVTSIAAGSPLNGAVIAPLARAIVDLFKKISDDPKTVAHQMHDFREAFEEECVEYMLQHFTEIFGEAE